jgi:hypothetical protein
MRFGGFNGFRNQPDIGIDGEHWHSPWTSKCSHPSDWVIPIPLHSFSSNMRNSPESSWEKYLPTGSMSSAHAWPRADSRLWNKLQHLFRQDDMSILEPIVRVWVCQ